MTDQELARAYIDEQITLHDLVIRDRDGNGGLSDKEYDQMIKIMWRECATANKLVDRFVELHGDPARVKLMRKLERKRRRLTRD